MVENKARLVPIENAWMRSARVGVNLPLPPYVENAQIGIDLHRTERLMNLGGIYYARIDRQKDTERSVSMPTMAGVNADGSLLGGRVGATKNVPIFEHEQATIDKSPLLRNAEWTAVRIILNLDEITQRIHFKGENVRKPQSWTPYLDQAVREGIRQTGTHHLLRGHRPFQAFVAFWLNIHEVLLDAAGISLTDMIFGRFKPHVPTTAELAFDFAFGITWWTLLGRLIYKNRLRYTLFPGYELDRAFLLQLLARTVPLVETITPNEDCRKEVSLHRLKPVASLPFLEAKPQVVSTQHS